MNSQVWSHTRCWVIIWFQAGINITKAFAKNLEFPQSTKCSTMVMVPVVIKWWLGLSPLMVLAKSSRSSLWRLFQMASVTARHMENVADLPTLGSVPTRVLCIVPNCNRNEPQHTTICWSMWSMIVLPCWKRASSQPCGHTQGHKAVGGRDGAPQNQLGATVLTPDLVQLQKRWRSAVDLYHVFFILLEWFWIIFGLINVIFFNQLELEWFSELGSFLIDFSEAWWFFGGTLGRGNTSVIKCNTKKWSGNCPIRFLEDHFWWFRAKDIGLWGSQNFTSMIKSTRNIK